MIRRILLLNKEITILYDRMVKVIFSFIFLIFVGVFSQGKDFRWESFGTEEVNGVRFNTMAIDSTGNRWFGSNQGIYIRTTAEIWMQLNTENTQNQLLNDTINDLIVDARGVVWIATNQGLNSYAIDGWEQYTNENTFGKLPSNQVLSLAIYQRDIKWIGTSSGFARLEGDVVWRSYPSQKIIAQIPYPQIRKIAVDTQERVWLGTKFGLYEFDGYRYHLWDVNTTAQKLPHSAITALQFDVKNSLWVGTEKGLSLYTKKGWKAIHKNSKTPYFNNHVNDITKDQKEGVWVSARGGLIHVINPERVLFFNASNTKYGILGFRVLSALEDSFGDLWVSSRKGLSRRILIRR